MQLDPQTMKNFLQIMNTPAGQQLIAMLQKNGGKQLESALKNTEHGNYLDAQNVINSLLANPEAKKLLEQLGR